MVLNLGHLREPDQEKERTSRGLKRGRRRNASCYGALVAKLGEEEGTLMKVGSSQVKEEEK